MKTPHLKKQITIVSALVAFCAFIAFYFQTIGIGEVYTHLFYIPIILSCIWWQRKGIIIALLLGIILITSHLILRQEISILNDLLRSSIFIIIAVFVSSISVSLSTAYKGLNLKNKEIDKT